MKTHFEHSTEMKSAGKLTSKCGPEHQNYGGECFNCGYVPEVDPYAETRKKCGVETLGPDDLIRPCVLPPGHPYAHSTGR